MNAEELQAKLDMVEALGHAVQSGVKFDQESGSECGSPKHLRVGVNLRACDHAAVVRLLIDKGIITEEEYYDSLIAEYKREIERYESVLTQRFGRTVKLG